MEDARLVQIRHAGADAAGQTHLHRRTERLGDVGQQLFERPAVDVLGERVQLTLVHAHAHETAEALVSDCTDVCLSCVTTHSLIELPQYIWMR